MRRGDILEGEIRAVLAADASTRRVVAVRTVSPRMRQLHRALRFGTTTVPLTLLIVAIALAAGLGLADWRAHRSTPGDSQAAAGGVPGPLALAGATPSVSFGLVSTSANTLLIRNEPTEAAPFTIANALPQVAVSPNGHDAAIWLNVSPGSTGIWELHVIDVLKLSAGLGPALLTVSAESPVAVHWSSDGTGLIAETRTPVLRGGPGNTTQIHTSWFAVDLQSRNSTELTALELSGIDGLVTDVYAWDRQRGLITGSGFYGGQNTFITYRSGRLTEFPVPAGATIAAADSYGISVVLAYDNDCKGPLGPTGPRCPVLEMRDQATFAAVTASPMGVATSGVPDVVFRPRSQDLIVQIPLQNGDAQVELWRDLGRGPHELLATYTQSVRFTGRRELMLPRVDGSAVFLLKFDGSAGGRWFGEIVSLSPNNGARGGQDPQRASFEILSGGNPLASIVLDPAFARALEPGRASASPLPSQSPVIRGAEPAIRAVQESPLGSISASFPRTIASEACDIHGGGPPPGIVIPGTCRTEVEVSGADHIVRFVETWDARRFHLAGEPSSGELEHVWSFLVDPSGTVTQQPDSGNFPPQYVR
jgi:hypothetical protein